MLAANRGHPDAPGGRADRAARAHHAGHSIAYRVNIMLTVLEAWAYVPADELAEAQDTASRLVTLTLAL
jgi:hypothetical protein